MGRNFDLCAEDRRATHAHNAHPTHTHLHSHIHTHTHICIYQIHVSNSRFINLSYEAMHKTDITTARVHGYIIKRPGIPLPLHFLYPSTYTSSPPSLPQTHTQTHKCNYTFQLTHELWNENCKKKETYAREVRRKSKWTGERGSRPGGVATPSITRAETLKLCEYICINF